MSTSLLGLFVAVFWLTVLAVAVLFVIGAFLHVLGALERRADRRAEQ